ncbi:hypothetical protein ACFQMG_35205, partial [Kitasatospora paranensis]
MAHDGEEAPVARRRRVQVDAGPTVRGQRHRSACDLHRRRLGRRRFRSELSGHPLPDPFRDGEFVALSPKPVQLRDHLDFQFQAHGTLSSPPSDGAIATEIADRLGCGTAPAF